jgi:hypothetical protein
MFALFAPADRKCRRDQCGFVRRNPGFRLTAGALLLLAALPVQADYRKDIGYTLLQSELDSDVPDGSGVHVSHIEAGARLGDDIAWMPDPRKSQFSGKTFTNESFATPGLFSSHANGTGNAFYGNTSSISPGILKIASYLSTHWLGPGLLRTGSGKPWFQLQPRTSSSRVGNHSWIGSTDTFDVEALSRLDWIIDRDEFVQVTGYTGKMNQPLLSSAYNVIAVNRSDAVTVTGSAGAGGIYTSGRSKPDLVVPASHTSQAVPRVASAAALLIGAAHERPSLSNDPLEKSVSNRNGDTIFNAERSEVIKAALMAGAARQTNNTSSGDITDYRTDPNDRTSNGLDRRFGAGQLNIYNSYRIIAAGEQNSSQDAGAISSTIGPVGFDYDPSFGGSSSSNSQASYFFSTNSEPVRLQASLVWNISIDGGSAFNFDKTATLYDLDLFIFDVTEPDNWTLVGSSESFSENSENVWLRLDGDRDYAIQVKTGPRQATFNWDYALAWQIAPP